MRTVDRYAVAVHSHNLRSDARTSASDADLLAAAGLASKRSPVGLALMRINAGDPHEAARLVEVLAGMLVGKAWHSDREKLPRDEARTMAAQLLAWHLDRSCAHCAGRGFPKVNGAPALASNPCRHCHGTGRRDPQDAVPHARRWLVRWLQAELEREAGFAAPAVERTLGGDG